MIISLESLKEKYNLNIKGIIHVGGHYGQEHKNYKANGIDNLIYFEPLISSFNILKQTVSEEGICINKALGSKVGKISMYVESANDGQSSSILKPKMHTEIYKYIIFNSEQVVDIDLLDNIEEIKQKEYNFINVDVQGYELEVFKGGIETLKNIDYIMTEVNKAELYENCVLIDELDTFLHENGFTRVETEWFYDHNWGDAFYIKNK
jgi:FkbM family methyltransferase